MDRIKKIADSHSFHRLVSIVIIFCSFLLGFETFFPEHKLMLTIVDNIITFFFLGEIFLRLLAESNPLHFFKLLTLKRKSKGVSFSVDEKGFWNWFDFVIVMVSVVSVFSHLFEHPEFLMVSRLFRVLRVMRLLEVSEDLKAVERKIVSIIPTVFSFVLLLGILLYIYAIIGIYLFSHQQIASADFRSLSHAFLTLFQLMTLDNWSDMMGAASANYHGSWFIKLYFVSFVVLTAIVSFNVFVAVLTSQVQEKMMKEQKESDSQLEKLEGEIAETGEGLEAGLQSILVEVRALRKEVDELRRK